MTEDKSDEQMLGAEKQELPDQLSKEQLNGDFNYATVATKKEKIFLKIYDAQPVKNATAAAIQAFNCKNKNTAGSMGSSLVKKFGLRDPKSATYPLSSVDPGMGEPLNNVPVREKAVKSDAKLNDVIPHGKMKQIESAFRSEAITFDQLFKEVSDIAFFYRDKDTALRALQKLKEWNDEANEERAAQKMADKDVVELLSDSLARVSKDKYLKILKMNRVYRRALTVERNTVIDAEAIITETHRQYVKGEL